MLRCQDNSLYTGWTVDLQNRLRAHQQGTASKYTRVRLPVQLVWYMEMPDKSTALKEEIRLKKLTKPQKERLIRSFQTSDDQ